MGLEKPLEIKLQLTENCNYNCGFCFNKQGYSSKPKTIETETAEKIISKVAEEGIKKIRITGGEPCLHPNLVKILEHAKSQGLETMLNTNASLLEKNIDKISENCDNILISFHNPLPKNVINTVKELGQRGCFVRAATILTKENIKNLEKFHSTIQELPFSQWVLLRQIPNALNEEPVSKNDMEIAVKKILSFNEQRPKKEWFLIENALPFCCSNPKEVSSVSLGGIHEDGHSNLFVDSGARIRPSYFFDVDLGQAPETNFLDAWNSDFMKRMNSLEFIAEECHACHRVLKCMSGSRFSALFSNKSLYALDPLANPENIPGLQSETNK